MAISRNRLINVEKTAGGARKRASGHTPKYAGATKFVVNCHSCKNDVANPSMSGIKVSPFQRTVICREGHVTVVRW